MSENNIKLKTYKIISWFYIYLMSQQSKEKTPNELLQEYFGIYLGTKGRSLDKEDEFEVRFGTNRFNTISKIDFDNIIEKIKSVGFDLEEMPEDSRYTLNIQNEFTDPRSGRTKMSNIRTTIRGIHNIQKYCKENTIHRDDHAFRHFISFLQKFPKRIDPKDNASMPLKPIDFHDFQFRVNYKKEHSLNIHRPKIENLLENWKDNKKVFRLIKRFTFRHSKYNFKIDCSIVRTSNKKKYYIPEYNIEDSNVFNNPENYEIELEMRNSDRTYNPTDADFIKNMKQLRSGIKLILSGWQQSNFPISFKEKDDVLTEYMKLIYEDKEIPDRRINTGDFIGPSSISLEIPNILPTNTDAKIPNINKPYTVTEKADGIRKLLYISKIGRIYFIDTNMNVQFTGNVTKHKNCSYTIIDGEHVLHDKAGRFINLYLAFDIYFKNKKNMKGFPFVKIEDLRYVDSSIDKDIFRLEELYKYQQSLDDKCMIKDYEYSLSIKPKIFYTNINDDIFSQCKIILDGVNDGTMFEYETDGLIFTPCDKSVGSNKTGEITGPRKTTWPYSLKWKPPEYNTIDFLVSTKKNENGEDIIGTIFEDGDDMSDNVQLNQYKTLILRVGFDEKKHGFINPCEDVIKENFPKFGIRADRNSYKPMPFYPHDPTPNYPIYLVNIMLQQIGNSSQLFTEDNKQVFEDNTIVEFKFDKKRKKYWQWIPIRVRDDKTADYKKGRKNYGNAYHVAESVWKSIHNPVTELMISTGSNIPESADADIYYNRTSKTTTTKALRDFHNRYIKRKLILDVSSKGDTLIDMTVGKAGDLAKWTDAKLSFVFGLDISKDNIENRIDGACARYLNARKKYRTMPRCLFIQANSSLNIKNGSACYSEKGKQIVKALNGEGPKDEEMLGKGVYNQYGQGKNGYDIVSNQFAIHYFFENINIFQNFIRNVSENCKIGGYFIGTCYDGLKIFRALMDKKEGESIFILNEDDDSKIWDIKKLYTKDTFENNESSLGYKIDVYQESINKTFSEYLVNFEYLTRMLENYGFVPINDDTAQSMGFPTAIGSFRELFDIMEEDIKFKKIRPINVGNAMKMTSDEKKISFLNNYFIYKKIRNPDAKEIALSFMDKSVDQEMLEQKETIELVESTQVKPKRKVKKYKKKLKLPTNLSKK